MGRVEAFSDGVIAVIVTIMVLELKPPENGAPAALVKLKLPLLVYALSFLLVAIYWVNHRDMLRLAKRVTPSLLWSNNVALFWLSLTPFATAYLAQSDTSALSVAFYGLLLCFVSLAFSFLRHTISLQRRGDERFERVNARLRFKDLSASVLYAVAAVLAFVSVRAAFFVFVLIPVLYFLPDRALAKLTEEMET